MLVAIVVGLFIADNAARGAAESALATLVEERSPGGDASVEIGGFLFVPTLVAQGKVSSINVVQSPVVAGNLTLRSVEVDVSGVVLDRSALVQRQRFQVKDIERGTVTATMDDAGLSAAVGIPLTLHPDGAETTVPVLGRVRVPVVLRGASLVVQLPAGRQLTVGLPSLPVMPCISGLTLGEGTAMLTCEITEVPAALLKGVGAAAAAASPG